MANPISLPRRRLFAGQQLRALRAGRRLRQADMADLLGISASYLSQLENDERPLTDDVVGRLRQRFPIDWHEPPSDRSAILAQQLREIATTMPLAPPLPTDQIERLAEQFPVFVEHFAQVHALAHQHAQRLEMLDEAIAAENPTGGRLPWDEVRDWFHLTDNYVDPLDRAAEALSHQLVADSAPLAPERLRQWLEANGVAIVIRTEGPLRHYDPLTRTLTLDASQPPESLRFQLAFQLTALAMGEEMARIVGAAALKTDGGRQLMTIGLGNYAAGALLMPYERFRRRARETRHDVDRLRQSFGTSFEQTCHRLSTLQRPQARGVPVYFCRVDMAGNITKRHSATRLQFARFGGACPLWIVHEAVAIPDRIHVQLAEMPDGARYVSVAKGLVKASSGYYRPPRRYAVALGCEASWANEFVYADGLNLAREEAITRIGTSCRICPREGCDQRAFPPNDQAITVDPDWRELVPYQIG